MLGILFSLFPLIGWGISDYVSSILSKKAEPATINLAFFLITGVPVVVFCSFFGWPEFTVSLIAQYFVVEAFLTLGFLTMVKAFSTGATGVVAPIANSYAIITLIIAIVFLNVTVTLLQVVAVIIVVSGIGLLSYTRQEVSVENRHKGELLALLAMVLFGVGFVGFDIISTQEWYQNAILFQLVGTSMAIVVYLFKVKHDRLSTIKLVFFNKIALVGGAMAAVGTVGMFIAIQNTSNIAIPATIAAASPLVTALLARHREHERLLKHQYAGMIFVVGGIAILSALSTAQ